MMTYNRFKSVAQESMGNEVGWNQLAVVFHLTKRAIEAAGSGGALAVHIKEMSLKYIEDRFAHWIVGQGGWVSHLYSCNINIYTYLSFMLYFTV